MGVSGMAAHIAADIFAHSAYAKQDGSSSYTRIIHKPNHGTLDDADNPDYIPNRFECARELVGKVVKHYYTSPGSQKSSGSYTDFILSSYNQSFKLHSIKLYLQQAGYSGYNTTYFNNMNTDVKE